MDWAEDASSNLPGRYVNTSYNHRIISDAEILTDMLLLLMMMIVIFMVVTLLLMIMMMTAMLAVLL